MDERALQFREHHAGSNPVDVVVGFDFGTASTKVVLRFPDVLTDDDLGRAYAVSFGDDGHADNPCLLPTSITFDDRGAGELAPRSGPGWRTNVKGRLVDALREAFRDPATGGEVAVPEAKESLRERLSGPARAEDADPFGDAVVFLARAMRRSREWLLREPELAKAYGEYPLRWSMHVGAPAGYTKELAFEWGLAAIAHAGWEMSLRSRVSRADARARLSAVVEVRPAADGEVIYPEQLADFSIVPEVVAEVEGYARTPELRRPGLHFLVDIGAGTLDVSGFVLGDRPEDDPRIDILDARVDTRGTASLQEARFGALSAAARDLDRLATVPDDFLPWAASQPVLAGAVANAEGKFRKNCANAIVDVVMKAKDSGDPNSPKWKDTVPVFLCGGGSRVPQFREAMTKADERLRTAGKWNECRLHELGRPNAEHLQADIDAGDFHRFAVAWGLSFPERATVRRPGEIEPIASAAVRRGQTHFVDKDNM